MGEMAAPDQKMAVLGGVLVVWMTASAGRRIRTSRGRVQWLERVSGALSWGRVASNQLVVS